MTRLEKGGRVFVLKNDVQIAAFLNSGWVKLDSDEPAAKKKKLDEPTLEQLTEKRKLELNKLTVAQLREIAEQRSIALGSGFRKDNLISLIIKDEYKANDGAE